MRNLDQSRFNFNPILPSHFSGFWNRAGQVTLLVAALGLTGTAEAGDKHRHYKRLARIEAATCATPLREVAPKKLLRTRRSESDQLIDEHDNPIRQTLVSIPIKSRHSVVLCKDYGMRLDAKVKDPAADEAIFLPVDVDRFYLSGRTLNIVFQRPGQRRFVNVVQSAMASPADPLTGRLLLPHHVSS